MLLLGRSGDEFGGSAYQRLLYGVEAGRPPSVDLGAEAALCALLRRARRSGWLSGCHDLAEGGLMVALAECAMAWGLGMRGSFDGGPLSLFSEGQGRAIVTASPARVDEVLVSAEALGVAAADIGEVGGERVVLGFDGGAVDCPVDDLRAVWTEALPRAVG